MNRNTRLALWLSSLLAVSCPWPPLARALGPAGAPAGNEAPAVGEPSQAPSPAPGSPPLAADTPGSRVSKAVMSRLEWVALGVLMVLFIIAVLQLRAQFDDDTDEE